MRGMILFLLLACIPFFGYSVEADEPAMVRIRELVVERFGESIWSEDVADTIAPLIHENKVANRTLVLVLGLDMRAIRDLDAPDAALALFAFAYHCDISLRSGEDPLRVRLELRTMLGTKTADGFKAMVRTRLNKSMRAIESMNESRAQRMMKRYMGLGHSGKGFGGK